MLVLILQSEGFFTSGENSYLVTSYSLLLNRIHEISPR